MSAYILRLIAGGFMIGICMCICSGVERLNWFWGLFILIFLLNPIKNGELDLDFQFAQEIQRRSGEITQAAQQDTMGLIREGIIQRTCAYILDEAESLGMEIQILSLALEEDGFLPLRVELAGNLSAQHNEDLTRIIQRDLGIGEEDVIWKESVPGKG